LKPAPQAPLTALALGEILREADMPDDAVQIVPCPVDVAEMLVKDDRYATLSFTGSAKVGWYLKSIAGKKRVLLELGGNAAAIVHEDARSAPPPPTSPARSGTPARFASKPSASTSNARWPTHSSPTSSTARAAFTPKSRDSPREFLAR